MSDGALIVIILGLGVFALIGWLAYLSMRIRGALLERYKDEPEDDS